MRTFTFILKLWKKKAGSIKNLSNPKLCLLPPTATALDLNIKRASYQKMIGKSCLQCGLPLLDLCKILVLVDTFKILQNQPTFYLYMALL